MSGYFKTAWQRIRWALTPSSRKQARVDDILANLELWDVSARLLDDLRKDGYTIGFDSSLYPKKGRFVQAYINTTDKKLRISPFATDGKLGASVLHELRHYWQEKNWGAQVRHLANMHTRARDHIFVRRVLEADAQAFSAMGAYVYNLIDEAARVLNGKMQTAMQGTKSKVADAEILEQVQQELDEYYRQNLKADDIKKVMKDYFLLNLKYYDSYDQTSLFIHHLSWIDPLDPVQKMDAPDFKVLRGLLRAGTRKNDASYIDDMTDKQLAVAVLEHIKPETRRTMKLMDRFQAAAANGNVPQPEKKKLQRQIRARITR